MIYFLLCMMALLFGFVIAQALTSIGLRMPMRRVERLSYGGVHRFIPDHGGLIAACSMAIACLPFVAVKCFSIGLSIVTILFCFLKRPRRFFLCLFIVSILLCVPDRFLLPFATLFVVRSLLTAQVEDADQVPGIPVALYAAPLAVASGLLVVSHHHMDALVGLVAAGALISLQDWHRFPPRLALGSVGIGLLVTLSVAVMVALLIAGEYLAIVMMWSFPIVDAISRMGQAVPEAPFETARLRGEPETGLALATGALSFAAVIAMLAVRDNSASVQAGAVVISFILAWQFRRFLLHGRRSPSPRWPGHRPHET